MSEKVLIVDDDVDTLRLVGLMLQRQGYQITAATNGEQGLEKAFEERPDVILLDVMMPDMDGYEVTRRLRKNPSLPQHPSCFSQPRPNWMTRSRALRPAADDYPTKPTHPAELQAHIRALLACCPAEKPEEMDTNIRLQHGRVIGVLGARGGLGASTIACNLAGASSVAPRQM